MDRGTDCRLKAKLKTAMEPVGISEAKATKTIMVNWVVAKVSVRGPETKITFLNAGQSTLARKPGNKPPRQTLGTWMRRWARAPTITPQAKPRRPRKG